MNQGSQKRLRKNSPSLLFMSINLDDAGKNLLIYVKCTGNANYENVFSLCKLYFVRILYYKQRSRQNVINILYILEERQMFQEYNWKF